MTRRWRRPRTAVRLALFHLVVLATVLGAAVAVMVRTFSARVDESATSALAAQLRSFQRSLGTSSHGRGLDEVASSYLATRALPSGTSLAIVVGRRAFVSPADARTLLASAPLGRLLARPLPRTVARRVDADHRDEEVLVAPIRSGGREVGVFVAALDLGPYDRESAHLALLASLEAAVALLAGVASAALLLRRLLRTIGGITTAAEEIATGQLDRRIGPQGADDEVGRLAATFDAMLDRLERAIDAQRRLLSDVSHQLRTPLTIARGHLEVLARTGFEDREEVSETVALVLDELDHLRHLVERLLLLGRSLEPDFLACEPVDVRGLVGDVREAASVLAPHGVRLGAVVDAVVDADVTKLRGALLNLLDNAVRATPPGGEVRLGATLEPGTGALALTVDDAGPGIDPRLRSLALERFARPGATDGSGSGLGLAIAKAVADAHGGELRLGTSPLGGCQAQIVLPASRVLAPRGDAPSPGQARSILARGGDG